MTIMGADPVALTMSKPGSTRGARLRLIGGTIGSTLWVALAIAYLHYDSGWSQFWNLPANEMADFFAGVAAPLAFLWLVLGYFQQGDELKLQRRELGLQRQELALQRQEVHRLTDETAAQRKAIEATEEHSRRDTFLRLRDVIAQEMAEIAFRLIVGSDRTDVGIDHWRSYSDGDRNVMFRVAVAHVPNTEILGRLLGNFGAARPLCERYCGLFDMLCTEAERADPKLILIFERSPMRLLYNIICSVLGRESYFKVCRST